MRSNQVAVYDCTLRDGTQGENISFSVEDKLRVARRLDEFGIAYIEGGWPGSNPKDVAFFQRARRLRWSHARLAAFGSTRHKREKAETDPNLRALLDANTPVVTIFGKSWTLHVQEALGATLQQNLDMIADSVAYLKARGREVIFDAEHFFDGYRADPDYAVQVLDTARDAGADWIVLCDTNGGNLPSLVQKVVGSLRPRFPRIGIHTHNDSELAVANSVAAVQAGARMVQGTINGYGERTGNANLTSLIPVLELKLGMHAVGREQLGDLSSLAHFVAEAANQGLPGNLPFVGKSAFAHKGGVHVSAISKNPQTYEHVDPEAVGNQRRVLVSDLSGRSNLSYKLQEMGGQELDATGLKAVLEQVKQLEFDGYQFEGAEASFKLLARRVAGEVPELFAFDSFRVLLDQTPDGAFLSEATVKLRVEKATEHTASDGNGPVHALDRALRKALTRFFPEIDQVRLVDYKVRVLDARQATAAKVRVLIESTDGGENWTTVGVSHNVIEASWKALVDSLQYFLVFRRPEVQRGAEAAAASVR